MRRLLFPLMRKFNFVIRIKHHYSKRPFYLKFWDHKGYWYFGADRERSEIHFLNEIISRDQTVVEIGSHIGYLTQIFEDLVGPNGNVVAIEPTPDSRVLLSKNVNDNTIIIGKAIYSANGTFPFHLENHGGFTNSLSETFIKSSVNYLARSQVTGDATFVSEMVEALTLDSLVESYNLSPDFLKIDVEGAELDVLLGGRNTLNCVTAIMIEVSSNYKLVDELMKSHDFDLFPGSKRPKELVGSATQNLFYVKKNHVDLSS